MSDDFETGPEKPPWDTPCNGCGFCCAAERCVAAEIAIGEGPGPCPLLTFHDGRFWCEMIETETDENMEPLIRNTLGIGKGCQA